MERKLRYMESEIVNDNVPIAGCAEFAKALTPNEIADLEVFESTVL
jgi:predicted peroxiredoxin